VLPNDPPTPTAGSATTIRIRLLVELELTTDDARSSTPRIEEAVDTALSTLPDTVPDIRGTTVSVLGPPHITSSVRGVFDLNSRELVVDGAAARLTPREAAVLAYLVQRRDDAVSREELRDALDDADGSLGPRAVDVILSRLRAKLPWLPAPLVTVRGVGYRYEPSAQFVVIDVWP
jgi:hypothetical protein